MAAPMENADTSDDEIRPKRKRNEAEWGRNKRKRLRAEGKEYVNSKKETVPARKLGEKCRCRRRCLEFFTAAARETLLGNFNTVGSQDGQDAYLMSLISCKAPQRRRPKGAQASLERSFQYYYQVKLGEDVKMVCREAFASLHGIGTKRVRRVAQHQSQGVTPKDKRGTHNNRKCISEDLKGKLDAHIRSFPYCVSHYASHGKKRKYLSSELTVVKKYTLFLELLYPDKYAEYRAGTDVKKIDCEVKFRFYYDYFKQNFNYGFGRPRSDVCCECTELQAKIKVEKNAAVKKGLETKLLLHKKKAKIFYQKLNEFTKVAQENADTECLCFDFKQNISFPHIPTGDVFYSRQLWLFVFGIHSAKLGKMKVYSWPETEAHRGVNEVVSSIKHYIDNTIPNTVRKLIVFTDGCHGQNHNHTMVQYLSSLVISGSFDEVIHRFPIRGHSYLPCDRNFGVIEKIQRRHETVETYQNWETIISEKFQVVSMKGKDMYDFKSHLGQFFKKSVTKDGEKFTISKYKVFEFSADFRNDIEVSQNMSSQVTSRFRLIKPNVRAITYPQQALYTEQLGVKAAKVQAVQKLARYLSEEAQAFLDKLVATDNRGVDNESDFEDE
uniref:uncharacterized protein isoform X1 n=2 Tax=Myxine glutinosa TaxID=7769 RepID=UPI00358DF5DA